jgi:hypothetical protein
VYYKPTPCSYCETPCTEYKQLCLLPQGAVWSNLSLTDRQLLTLAKLNLLQSGWMPLELERQLPNACIRGANGGPDLRELHQYWRDPPHWASTPEVNEQVATEYLELLCATFRTSDPVRGGAIQLYSQANRLLREHCIEALVTAAFYLSCKRAQTPLTMRDLTFSPLLQQDVWTCYRQILGISE